MTIVAQLVDTAFLPHVPTTMNLVLEGIRDVQNHKTCQYATNLLSDIIGLLGTGFLTYADVIMEALFENLRNPEVDRSVKPYIYGAFNEIALSLGDPFQNYLPSILNVLVETCEDMVSLDDSAMDEETLEYLDALREGLFSAFTGVLTEVKTPDSLEVVYHCSKNLLILVEKTAYYNRSSLDTITAAIGLVGDLAHKLNHRVKPFISETTVGFVQYFLTSHIPTVKEEAQRVDGIFRKIGLY